jgi:hypothetical protein
MRGFLGRGDIGRFHRKICRLFPGSYRKDQVSPEVIVLIRCSKNRTPIFPTRRTNTSYQRHNFHTIGANALKSLTGAR